jgi:hypothetical protein
MSSGASTSAKWLMHIVVFIGQPPEACPVEHRYH